jgi:hypothetical protein
MHRPQRCRGGGIGRNRLRWWLRITPLGLESLVQEYSTPTLPGRSDLSPDGGAQVRTGLGRTHSLCQAQAQASTSTKHQARITQWVSQRAVRMLDPRSFNKNSALRAWWFVPAQQFVARCSLPTAAVTGWLKQWSGCQI